MNNVVVWWVVWCNGDVYTIIYPNFLINRLYLSWISILLLFCSTSRFLSIISWQVFREGISFCGVMLISSLKIRSSSWVHRFLFEWSCWGNVSPLFLCNCMWFHSLFTCFPQPATGHAVVSGSGSGKQHSSSGVPGGVGGMPALLPRKKLFNWVSENVKLLAIHDTNKLYVSYLWSGLVPCALEKCASTFSSRVCYIQGPGMASCRR